MAVYEYKAVRNSGEAVKGTLDADSARKARELLRGQGLFVTEVRRTDEIGLREELRRLIPFRRDRRKRILWFTRELHLLVVTGLPLREALASLARAAPRDIRAVIRSLRDGISKGDSLSTGLDRHPGWFDGLYVSMVQAGERSGQLPLLLGNLSRYLQEQQSFREQVQTALLYPKLVGLATLGVVVFLMSTVVPRLIEVIERRGGDLPLPTRVLQQVSGFFSAYWLWCVLGVAGLWVVWQILSLRPGLRAAWERLQMSIPIVGELRRKWAAQQFSVMLGALLQGGVVLSEALAQLSETAASPLIAAEAEAMHRRIVRGEGLVSAEGGGIFPGSFSEMLAAGQETGTLESVLDTVAESYGLELRNATKKVAVVVEPVAILAVALVVAFVVAAVLLPVFEMGQIH